MIKETKLKNYFPMIRTREEITEEIKSRENLLAIYNTWKDYEKEEFLNFCTGAKGVKMLYDSFFKEVFNPELAPERLSDFLSQVLGQKVKVLLVLPNDTTRIADENALLITDIVVELEDGSIVNVEVQKIGYMFPGERAACYSADLLLRQYKRIRDKRKKKFTYKDVKPVYVIVLFEESPAEFKAFEEAYIHHFKSSSDTGLKLDLLQEFYFISLDIFQESLQNKGVTGELEAWLTFFCTDEPKYIVELITKYSEFKSLYEDVYQLCLNTEKVMEMFSEELRMLDVNTTQFMIDTMQEKIDEQKSKMDSLEELLKEKHQELDSLQDEIDEQQGKIDEQQGKIDEQQGKIDEQKGKIDEQQGKIDEQQGKINNLQGTVDEQAEIIRQLREQLEKAEITK